METKLNFLYSRMFKQRFDASSFSDRLKLQKAVYLIECCGVNLGDYNFFWHKHGPYSQILQNEILSNNICVDESKVAFSPYQTNVFNWFHRLIQFSQKTHYDIDKWLETVASIHYILVNILSTEAQDDEVLETLRKMKPHLNDQEANCKAIGVARSIISLRLKRN